MHHGAILNAQVVDAAYRNGDYESHCIKLQILLCPIIRMIITEFASSDDDRNQVSSGVPPEQVDLMQIPLFKHLNTN